MAPTLTTATPGSAPRLLAARWVLPVTEEPIEEGAVLIEGERIVAVGHRDALRLAYPDAPVREFGRAIILPGFVNAHSHLDYTALRGRVGGKDLAAWIQELTRLSREWSPLTWRRSAEAGAREVVQAGATCIGDTTRTGAVIAAASQTGLRAVVFREVFGLDDNTWQVTFDEAIQYLARGRRRQTDRLRLALSPHAPYTVSGRLIAALAAYSRAEGLPLCMHVAESAAETSFLRDGSGPLAAEGGLVHTAWPNLSWQPPGVSPVAYLDSLGALGPGLVAAHCIHVDDKDIARLARSGAAVVHCPKSNLRLGNGLAPVAAMLDAGITVALGTDSAASNDTLDLFGEMRFALLAARARDDGGRLSERQVVEMATLAGAKALGWDSQVGSLEPGKEADIAVVRCGAGGQDASGDPYATLIHACEASDVQLTMVAGRVLFDSAAPAR